MALKIGKLFSLGGGGGGDDGSSGGIDDLKTPTGRVAAIIAEIGNSAQQRRITVTIGSAELVMDVGAKQLFRVISVKPQGLRFAKATNIEARSYDNLDNQLIIITQLLTEVACFPGEIDIISRPGPNSYPSKTEGFMPQELKFAAWKYAPTEDELKTMQAAALNLSAAAPAVAAAPAPAQPAPSAAAPDPAPAPEPVVEPVVAAPPPPAAVVAPPPAPAPEPEPEPDEELAPAPEPASKAKKSPMRTMKLGAGTDTAFHDMISSYCDITLMVNPAGDVMICTEDSPEWEALAGGIASDMLRWIRNTASVLPEKQLIVMRSQLPQSQSVCFYLDGENITFAVISSVAIGRLFSAGNEFFSRYS